VDAQTYLPDDLLTKMDRATMAWGLEARSPLLDQDLWEWAAGLPRGWFLDARSGKNLVRDAYRGVLPEPILSRAKKGFSVPLASWLRGELREQVMDLLVFEGGALPDLIDSAAAASVVERFMTGEHASPYKVWNLVALASWFGLRRAPLPRKLTPVLTRA
jgi:asparagine synthase (glutamine-hydrolysing)